ARRKLNPSTPMKMAMGLAIAGVSFLPLIAAAEIASTGVMASVWWLVLAYLLLEIGEVCLSPIGLSAVTQLSVARVVGVMMGAFWLATAYSEVLAAQFGKLASLEMVEGATLDMAAAAAKYEGLFATMLWIGLGSGLVVLLLTPLLKRAMHGVN
ncbi:MAG: MFS transporter, partial [Pseudomonadota bacterium]|nr:MFS transporter [Pseudomonadota bacterium]